VAKLLGLKLYSLTYRDLVEIMPERGHPSIISYLCGGSFLIAATLFRRLGARM